MHLGEQTSCLVVSSWSFAGGGSFPCFLLVWCLIKCFLFPFFGGLGFVSVVYFQCFMVYRGLRGLLGVFCVVWSRLEQRQIQVDPGDTIDQKFSEIRRAQIRLGLIV